MTSHSNRIGDNTLVSYTVNEQTRTIVFETVFYSKADPEYSLVVFSGVAAYFFENHSMQGRTILFDIEEIGTEPILDANWATFEERKNWGWPGDWVETPDTARAFLKENGIRGYEVQSSCGLSGWVLAKDLQFAPGNWQPPPLLY